MRRALLVVLLPLGLGFAFLLAWLGSLAGLASIVGAYAAGLILEPAHIEDLERREQHTLEELVHPLVTVLSPLFFVLMGAKVDPVALFKPATLGLAAVLAARPRPGRWVVSNGDDWVDARRIGSTVAKSNGATWAADAEL